MHLGHQALRGPTPSIPATGFLSGEQKASRAGGGRGHWLHDGLRPLRHIGEMGQKARAREIMEANGFPRAAGSGLLAVGPRPESSSAARCDRALSVMVKARVPAATAIGMAVPMTSARYSASILRGAAARPERSFADGWR